MCWSLSLIGGAKAKMSTESTDIQDLFQHADQLFDENQFQEAIDILKKHPVSIFLKSLNIYLKKNRQIPIKSKPCFI